MTELDARLHAFRPDLGDEALRGKVEAANYVKPVLHQIAWPLVSVIKRPEPDAPQTSQALMGERCSVFEKSAIFSWVQLARDGYVGYVPTAALSATLVEPTHRVIAASTLIYPKADLKSHPVQFLPINAEVKVEDMQGAYARLSTGGFVFAAHLGEKRQHAPDMIAVAEMFLNVPYYWGGKSAHGIDCSGLVQTALHATGHAAPRDSDMQEKSLGLPVNDFKNLRRGDFIFWPGHVGIMQSDTQLLHANGHFMKVVSEPLQDAVARSGAPIRSVRRMSV